MISMCYMIVRSKPLDRLGCYTNFRLMIMYAIIWALLGFLASVNLYLIFGLCSHGAALMVGAGIDDRKPSEISNFIKYCIATASFTFPFYICMASLDLLVIYAYHRFGTNLTDEQKRRMTFSLRA